MAMLAEPRQRKRYNLVPRGKALYEDDSRFGTKMLERMGWSKGKGLGAKEDGSQDFVRVRYKNDIQGLGFEHRDDQWTQHETSFNGLLKSLNGEEVGEDIEKYETHQQSVESEDDMPRVGFGFQNNDVEKPKKSKKSKLKEKISGVSLEERSKQSKARVHYKKFTRGKDLSQYSEKDLANIFGKKAEEDEQETAANDLYNQLNQIDEKLTNDGADISEDFGGVQTISTGLSVADYFKMKMNDLKNRKGHSNSENNTKENCMADVEEGPQNDSTRKKKKKKNKYELTADVTVDIDRPNENADHAENVESENRPKKKCEPSDLSEMVSTEKKKEKKKKKHKNIDGDEKGFEGVLNNVEIEEEPEEKKIPKKRKKIPTQNEDDGHSEKKVKKSVSEIEVIEKNKSQSCKRSNPQNQKEDNNKPGDEIENTKSEEKKTDSKEGKEIISSKTKKDVSQNVTLDAIRELSSKQLQEELNSFNVYRLSSFCAEKFRNINLNYFPKSTLSKIEGYGFNQEIQLNVVTLSQDEERITNLWKNSLSKYGNVVQPAKTYKKYMKGVILAKQQKTKAPKFNYKTWKRKNAFSLI